jgi:hypothetical protein
MSQVKSEPCEDPQVQTGRQTVCCLAEREHASSRQQHCSIALLHRGPCVPCPMSSRSLQRSIRNIMSRAPISDRGANLCDTTLFNDGRGSNLSGQSPAFSKSSSRQRRRKGTQFAFSLGCALPGHPRVHRTQGRTGRNATRCPPDANRGLPHSQVLGPASIVAASPDLSSSGKSHREIGSCEPHLPLARRAVASTRPCFPHKRAIAFGRAGPSGTICVIAGPHPAPGRAHSSAHQAREVFRQPPIIRLSNSSA